MSEHVANPTEPIIAIGEHVIGDETVQAVNARELWEALESKQQYADWIKSRIEKYGFTEGEDFIFHKLMKNKSDDEETRGRAPVDYIISTDMAKELAMVENNEKGRQVRKYFIRAEKELRLGSAKTKEQIPPLDLDDEIAKLVYHIFYYETQTDMFMNAADTFIKQVQNQEVKAMLKGVFSTVGDQYAFVKDQCEKLTADHQMVMRLRTLREHRYKPER